MMHLNRTRTLAAVGVIAMAAASLAGCSAPKAETASAAPETASAAPEASGPVTITYEAWGPSQAAMDKIVADFEAANAGVKVKATLLPYADYVTAIKTELASGAGPDVFDLQAGGMLDEFQSLLQPMDPLAKAQLGDNWKASYSDAALKQASIGDQVYGLPHGFQTAGFLWVNKSLLKKNGIDVPSTYSDLVAACKKLRSKGLVPVAIGAKDDWMDIDIFSSMSNAIAPGDQYAAMDGDGTWTTPGLVKSFDAFAAMFKDGVAQDGAVGATTYTDTYDLFADGKAGFFTNGSWNQDMFVSIPDRIGAFEVGVMPMPTVSGPAPVIAGIGGLLAVNKTSKQQGAAFKLAQYMAGGPGQQTRIDESLDFAVTSTPVNPTKDVGKNAADVRAELAQMLASKSAGYREVPNAAVKSALGQALIKLAAGQIDGAAAAQQVQKAKEDAGS